MSNVPRTIRSLILWGRSFPERQPSFNVAFIAIRNHFQQEQLMANSFHVIFAFITPLVLNLLGLRYQGNLITPFDTQPITMMVGISCFPTDSIRTLCIAVHGLAIICPSQNILELDRAENRPYTLSCTSKEHETKIKYRTLACGSKHL
ncbi:hypothetical protein FCV25MIE_14900 [Fagus crenata]